MPVVAGGHSYKRTHRGKERFPGFTITYALMEALEKVMEDTNGDLAKIVTKAERRVSSPTRPAASSAWYSKERLPSQGVGSGDHRHRGFRRGLQEGLAPHEVQARAAEASHDQRRALHGRRHQDGDGHRRPARLT